MRKNSGWLRYALSFGKLSYESHNRVSITTLSDWGLMLADAGFTRITVTVQRLEHKELKCYDTMTR